MSESTDLGGAGGWDTYWTGARDADAFTSGGVGHPGISTFWDGTLSEVLANRIAPRLLDIASGSGAVIERLLDHPTVNPANVTCVDISSAAVDGVKKRFPGVIGIISDARDIPLESGSFDVVTSQFGVEYAGSEAINEAMRLVAKGGSLLLMLHVRSGLIYEECSVALEAVLRTQRCEFVPRALRLFEAGFAAVRGANREPYERAATVLNPAIMELESIMNEYGEHVAGDTVARLYADVGKIHGRIQYYDPDEVLAWLRLMEIELIDYQKRMASMCEAALDDSTFAEICKNLGLAGFNIVRNESLVLTGSKRPIALVLRADRPD